VPAAGGTLAVAALRVHAAARLPSAMVPTAWVALEQLPLDRNLKVDRKALPEPMPEPRTAVQGAPRDERERQLAGLWAAVLKTDAVGVDDDFFALGGDSLQAMELAARIAGTLGVELPPEAIFQHATVARLARHLADHPHEENAPAPARHRDGPLPLSFAQQRLWFLDRFEGASMEYHIAQAARIRGPLDRAAFERAIAAIIARHDSLRTRFPAAKGAPVQEIAATMPFALAFAEAGEDDEATVHATLRRWRDEPFELERGPLFRAALLRLGERDHVLLCVWHHIVADGWSVGVFNRELTALYAAAVAGKENPLPSPGVQYARWAAAQRERLGGATLAALAAHWCERLRDAPALELPLDHVRPPRQTFVGARHDFAVPADAAARLRALAATESATPFMALLAVFKILLARASGQDDVTVGTPIANRSEPALHGAIGLFTGLLVLRTDLAGRPTFREALARVRRTAVDAYAHQALPFEKLVEELNPPRDLGRHPLFHVLFALQNADATPLQLAGATAEPWPLTTDSTHVDLELHLTPVGDTWTATLVFNTALFLPATIARMAGHFLTLLDSLLTAPDRPVTDAALLTDAERHDLLVTWNATAVPEPADPVLHRLVAAQARRTPGAIALADGGQTLTYAQLDARADRLAARLRTLGVGAEVRVGVCLARTAALPVALLAVLKAGGAFVPLDPQFPPARLALVLEDAAAPVIVAERSFAGLFKDYAGKIIWADDPVPAAPAPGDTAGPANAAYVIYTSGSTGRPKGVVIEHRSVVNALGSLQREPGLAAGDVFVAGTTVSFDISVAELFLPLVCGARVVVAPDEARTDGRALAALLDRCGATVFQATPATWKLLLQAGWAGRPGLRAWVGGEALPAALVSGLLPRVSELWNLYGPTETTIWSLLARVESAERIVIGRPLANTQVHVVDVQMQPVPVGVAGELVIGGAGVARGYLHREALTAEKFLPDPFAVAPGARLYRTGDRCRRLAGGEIEFLGRMDAQVKLRGFRIELGEIEAALRRHADVRDAAAAVQEDAAGERHLVACIVPAAEGAPAAEALREFLRRTLPDYMVPAQFVSAAALPLTPNGKVNRAALPRPDFAPCATATADAAPRTLIELRLLEAWRRVFRNEAIGREDNFFALGGHSLLAAELAVAMEAAAGRRVPIAALFRAPTVAALATLLEGEGGVPMGSALVPLRPAGDRAPLFCIHGWGGDVFGFAELARTFGAGRPIFGVRANAAGGNARRAPTVEEMADRYAREIRAVFPTGPYHLIGHSAGGWMAYGVAMALHRLGGQVATLGLLDTEPAFPLPWHLRLRLMPAVLARRLGVHWRAWHRVPWRERGEFLRDKWRAFRGHAKSGGFGSRPKGDPIMEAVARYRPEKYPGDVTLFVVVGSRLTLVPFWRSLVRRRVMVCAVAGAHDSLIGPENAAGFARVLARVIDENERAIERG
ncbi:MAG: amino acid adenylation domain-containing protein, partial [Opitutaceae bacterium]|nr:amino acid adenylation domain-containing protein [Opitutaceae bacterium]